MKFGLLQKVFFGADEGAYSIVTADERDHSQITLTDADGEADIAIRALGADNIPRRAAQSRPVNVYVHNYFDMLQKKLAKCHADPDPKPEDRKEIDAMLQIANDYDRAQIQLEQRQRALEIRQAEYELKAKRAAQVGKRDKERAAERQAAAERKAPRDFDNSARIAAARAAHQRLVLS